MTWFNVAMFFAVGWWIVLFAVLPWGLRTQDESGEIVPGTPGSAPVAPRMLRIVLVTTLVTLILLALFAGATYLGVLPPLRAPLPA
ncbi:DUF1467 family protein [Zavarzinia sp. CC-PAN008]|uniref:DUF1467 family protein n=1 Tax=Zavarzinia sp. CC-PAN008 TaxID=3243332 RepID=UPI003F747609